MAKSLNLTVASEGVETQDQLERPRKQGVTCVQGCLLGKLQSLTHLRHQHGPDRIARKSVETR